MKQAEPIILLQPKHLASSSSLNMLFCIEVAQPTSMCAIDANAVSVSLFLTATMRKSVLSSWDGSVVARTEMVNSSTPVTIRPRSRIAST